ncbi:MAG: glycosyltransferase family 2 protein [candidate division WWE3 bacterium]|nr:glycosyltransferase family 2 protein [candidate division WWE3 bacterium]
MTISIVIVNYNTREILLKCLENLQKVSPEAQVIVVDNGSSDGSADAVASKFSEVSLIRSTNVGLSAGYNLGLVQATGDFVLLLGTDAFPESSTLPYLVNFMNENPKAGLVTCRLVLRSGQTDWDAHRGFPTPWVAIFHFLYLDRLFATSKLFNGYTQKYQDLTKTHEIDLCISHFMLIRRQTLIEVGPFDENFFVFGEDVDFCYRVKAAGWKIFYVPEVTAVHYKGASVGVRKETADITQASKETRLRMTKSASEAQQQFYKKHLASKYPKLLNAAILGLIDLRREVISLKYRF